MSCAKTRGGKYVDLTQEKFEALMVLPIVKKVATELAENADKFRSGEWTELEWKDFKDKRKEKLPVMTVHGRTDNGLRQNQFMVDAQTVLLDIDGMKDRDGPRTFFEQRIRPRIVELDVLMAKVSISGTGIQTLCRRPAGMTIEQAQAWLAGEFDIGENYDHKPKDLARMSYMVPKDYLLYVSDELFEPVPSLQAEHSESSERSSNAEPLKLQPSTNTLNPLPEEGQEIRLPQTLADVSEDLTFRGIPYKAIIAEFFARTGGEPAVGERNCRLQVLVSNLRTICDYNEELMRRIVPTYGLPEKEVSSMIHGHCALAEKDKPRGLSKKIMDIVRYLSKGTADSTALSESAAYTDYEISSTLPESLVRRLPKALQVTLSMAPKEHGWPALALTLPMVSCLADGVTFRYCDNKMSHVDLYSVVVGEQGTGKGVLELIENLWMHTIREDDDAAREAQLKYDEDFNIWAIKQKKGSKEEPPQKPKCCIRYLEPRNSSADILYQLQNSEGHSLFMCATEMEEIGASCSGGAWADTLVAYRKGFDREWHGQSYVSKQSVSGRERVALNMAWTGTPMSFYGVFTPKVIANGLTSRFLVAEMPKNRFAKMPHYEELPQAKEQIIEEAVERMKTLQGEVKVPKVVGAISQWCEEHRQDAEDRDDDVAFEMMKRSAKMGARAGVVVYLLSGCKKEPQIAVDAALYVANQSLAAQLKYFGAIREKQLKAPLVPAYKKPSPTLELLNLLPQDFTTADVAKVKGFDNPDKRQKNLVLQNISKWKKEGRVEKDKSNPHLYHKKETDGAAQNSQQ